MKYTPLKVITTTCAHQLARTDDLTNTQCLASRERRLEPASVEKDDAQSVENLDLLENESLPYLRCP